MNIRYLGSIKLDDLGYTIKCSEEQAMAMIKEDACKLDVQFVNISSEAYPDYSSTCYRCVADMYILGEDTVTRKIINRGKRSILYFTNTETLEWDSFEITMSETSTVPYQLYIDIKLHGSKPSMAGIPKSVNSEAVVYADLSGVKKSYKTEQGLKHLNGLFQLAQLHAFRLSSFLESKDGRTAMKGKAGAQGLVDQIYADLNEERKRYVEETEFGQNKIAQEKWSQSISDRLDVQ
ncbi:MAG: hypothetical protein R2813_04720 [Flavobacteriales bacterium]